MTTPASLLRLMHYVPLARSFKLGEEDAMAAEFANELRLATLQGRLKAVFCHVPNELGGMVNFVNGKPRVPPRVALAKALGLITGTADYLFLAPDRSLALEAKSATGSLSKSQRDFREWAAAVGVPFHVFRTVDEGLAHLRAHGLLENPA